MGKPLIPGGYIYLSRKVIESEIWDKPPLYIKVWIYLLSQAQHKDYKKLKRGQLRTSIPEIREACSWHVGYRKETPSKDQVYKILNWLRNPHDSNHESNTNSTMITTTKATQGMLVTIDNYCFYQNSKNYESNDESDNEDDAKELREQHSADNINKNGKNDKNDNKKDSPKQVYDETHYQLAVYFFERIKENNPQHKKPNFKTWSNDIRLMMEQDNRNEEQIKYLMKWVQQDDFEKANVLSPSKLRKRFDQLVIKVKNQKAPKKNWKEMTKKDDTFFSKPIEKQVSDEDMEF